MTSIQILRLAAFGPRRKWKQIFQTKQNSLLELSNDLLWITKPFEEQRKLYSVMQRISGEGRTVPLYKIDLYPRPKEVAVYEIPDPIFKASVPPQEYQPVMLTLRKGSVLTRHNLENGRLYNRIHLSPLPFNSLSVSFVSDILIVKSPKLKFFYRTECFFRFHVFQMHPFKRLATFDIDGSVFPDVKHKSQYGKLRNAEIHDGLLIIMTEKNFSLIYDAENIIEEKSVSTSEDTTEFVSGHEELVEEAPPLLFATFAHMDILGLGACPWMYIRAVSDSVLEVRDLGTEELLDGGRVMWKDGNDEQISPDYLMFHPDDSSRVIHVRTSEIRILAIHERCGKRTLEEEFIYPKRGQTNKTVESRYSRSGRLIKSTFELDDSLNTALAFNVETDLRVLVIVEARRDVEHNCTKLQKITFFDSLSYDLLHEMDIFVKVDGDIETNRLSVNMDRDILNIVSRKGSQQTILSFRLKEVMEEEESQTEKVMLRKKICNNISNLRKNGLMNSVERDEEGMENVNVRQRRALRRNSSVTAVERHSVERKKRRRLRRNNEFSDESDDESGSDEWIP
ncbi:DDB1- and CUL4-associated factor 17-like isoform X2 [Panulirus ornatus]|uniref:DDB1- and CUL4-associated factor 17-like isoform X2 n=1 Tax=Panulirus ornatus TaxID=150431 RepID=UPI003A8B7DDC